MSSAPSYAPGWPGIEGRWTSSAKSGVGTATGLRSRVWFTLSHGILDEVYYPRVDQACTRDLGLIVTDGAGFFSEEKRDAASEVEQLAAGVPAYRLTNTCRDGRYRIEKLILSDPKREVVLQKITFTALQGGLGDYRLHTLLAPHLGNRGAGNTGWVGDYKGEPMLLAEGNGSALALGCSAPWLARSVGFAGISDGWQDLSRHFRLTWAYDRAENGNVALVGEIDLAACGGTFVLALGFGWRAAEAAHRARRSLQDGFEAPAASYLAGWQEWQADLLDLDPRPDARGLNRYRVSTAVLHSHEDSRFPGAIIASLSIPWGFAKGDNDLGGYHLIWPRDLVEVAGGLIAAGAHVTARRVLHFLQATQEADGCWTQNMWLDGASYWGGVQMDETALPIVLVDLARREGALPDDELARVWPMVHRAAGYLVRNGPVTGQDRWEEDGGYSVFTLAAEVAGLLAAADLAELHGAPEQAAYLRETADSWNDQIERWTYAIGTPLAQQVGVDGYYVRIAPLETADGASPLDGFVPIKNRPPGQTDQPATAIVSPDALALVRFGLRAADDPRIVNTVKVIDTLLKAETPTGPCWRRYNEDGYGEHEDGSPFDGTGIGRLWPLLTGERAHYELAAGRPAVAEALLHTMESFASDGGLLPEQTWDAPDIPERELFLGRPTGSAMPLAWAHAEHIKLLRSLRDGAVFDLPPQPVQRYQVDRIPAVHFLWCYNHKVRSMPAGRILRVMTLAPVLVHWSADEWRTAGDVVSRDSGFGTHIADLPTRELGAGDEVVFTLLWQPGRWEGADYAVAIA